MNQLYPSKLVHIMKLSLFTIKIILLFGFIIFAIVKIFGGYLNNIYYSVESSKKSPDLKFTITQLHSVSEGGHAPYGRLLVLSRSGAVKNPDVGHVIFAGYCTLDELSYSWVDNENISIICPSTEKEPVRSVARKAYSINVILEKPHNQVLKMQPSLQ